MAFNSGNANRQKMINLMYIVFIAMLALNVSSEVLDGFAKVEQSLKLSIASTEIQNELLGGEMRQAYQANPTKVGTWYEKGEHLSEQTDSLFSYIQFLKLEIARATDGDNANVDSLEKQDYLGASEEVMLNPLSKRGKVLKKQLNTYAMLLDSLLPNSQAKETVLALFDTNSSKAKDRISWEEQTFGGMPSASAITLLTKMQADLRYTEGYVYSSLMKQIDAGDIRVNKLSALVVPESKVVLRGTPYKAQIILSSIDSTQSPDIFVNGQTLSKEAKGNYSVNTNKLGQFAVEGYIDAKAPSGEVQRTPFKSDYRVIEPMVSVAPTLMNVLYAGINNELKITVPGVPMSQVSAKLSGSGTLTRKGDFWIIKPSKVGENIKVLVYATMLNGKSTLMGQSELRVRALPDPSPYIALTTADGKPKRFKGGRISKRELISAGGVKAAIDDSLIDFAYQVLKFQLISFDSMGNALPEQSQGAKFSSRQLDKIRNTARGKRLYITEIIARGGDGIERRIPSLELIIN